MGCLKLHIKSESNLSLAYSKKGIKPLKKTGSVYPFGLKHKGYNNVINGTHHPYGYGGKEENDELGLNVLDFGARNYNPDLGRWMNIDPFAELMRNQSPYNYGFNNPIYFSDYEGNIPWPVPEMFKIWKRRIDSKFGPRNCKGCSKFHKGLDINFGSKSDDYGAPVYATHSGTVSYVNTDINSSGGRYIEITSFNGSVKTRYLHLSSISIKQGDEINEGATIGLIGGSGRGSDTGYAVHLHYELHINSKATNPIDSRGNLIDPQMYSYPAFPTLDYLDTSPFAYTGWLVEVELWKIDIDRVNQEEAARVAASKRTTQTPITPIIPNPITPSPSPSPIVPSIVPTPITPTPVPLPAPRIEPTLD